MGNDKKKEEKSEFVGSNPKESETISERGRETERGIKGKRGAYAVKRAHYGRPAAAVVWGGTVNNCLHLGQCPGGVELEASDGHTEKTAKHSKLKKRKAAQIDTCNTDTQISPFHTFFHIDRIRNTFSWVCQAAPLTKKHLGTGLVGLQRIHICPVQAIGIQSFRLSNATRREQSRAALFFAFAAPL